MGELRKVLCLLYLIGFASSPFINHALVKTNTDEQQSEAKTICVVAPVDSRGAVLGNNYTTIFFNDMVRRRLEDLLVITTTPSFCMCL